MRECLGNVLLLLAGLLVATGILGYVRSIFCLHCLHPCWAGINCVPIHPLSRRQLLLLATEGRLSLCAPCVLALTLYLLAMRAYGVLSIVQLLSSIGTVYVIMALPAWILYQNSLLPLQTLMREKKSPLILRCVTFRYVRGAWQFVDGDWFIRVGSGESCALRSSELDFCVPVHLTTCVAFRSGARFPHPVEIDALRFCKKDGRTQIAITQPDDDLTDWVKRHGGCVGLK